MNQNRRVGIIGGMGPLTTVDFMSRVIAATPAQTDQDHIQMFVDSDPHVPNRQQAMRGDGVDPGSAIADVAKRLQTGGADFLVMPCNLAHAWQSDIEAVVDIPFVSIVAVTVQAVVNRTDDQSAVGLMTTPGCFTAGLYQRALADGGRDVILQTADELSETMAFVDRIKAGDQSTDVATGLRALANRLVARGARAIVAACTEFPLVLEPSMFDVVFVSSTEELARRTVALARGTDTFDND